MPDLYAVLGVPRDANTAAIRKAYRSVSKRAHPDGGGSPERFRMVRQALEVLRDAARRKAYDETGKIEDKPVDNEQSEIMGLVSALLDAVLQNADQTGEPWEMIDIVQRMLRIAAENQIKMEKQRRAMKDGVTRQRKLLKRFVLKAKAAGPVENRMETLMVGRIAFLEGQDRMAVIKLETMRKAVALIDEYKFESEKSSERRAASNIGNFVYQTF